MIVVLDNARLLLTRGGTLWVLLRHRRINPAFALEVLPNRDAMPYTQKYGIPDVQSMFRGTLRYEVCFVPASLCCLCFALLRFCFARRVMTRAFVNARGWCRIWSM